MAAPSSIVTIPTAAVTVQVVVIEHLLVFLFTFGIHSISFRYLYDSAGNKKSAAKRMARTVVSDMP